MEKKRCEHQFRKGRCTRAAEWVAQYGGVLYYYCDLHIDKFMRDFALKEGDVKHISEI